VLRWRPREVVRAALPARVHTSDDAAHWAAQVFQGGTGDWGEFDRGTVDVPTLAARIAASGAAHIESDMRAHRNPRRMRAIKRAMIDLVRRARSRCPECARPGFGVTGRLAGLPCAWCTAPTLLTRAEVWTCAGCGHREERPIAVATADPMHCEECNP
jgi:hypothetical protein